MDIPLEQLVYGSFPFWDRGYDVLARSPGWRPEWESEVLAACRRFGEAPAGLTPAPALFSLRLASGPRAIVGVEPQGVDDRGRPGALAFHALLVAPEDDRKAGFDPFAFAGALRRDWSSDTTLATLTWPVKPTRDTGDLPVAGPVDPRARRIIATLAIGRRVALESPEPIDRLAREVWPVLPESVRRNASVATFAFGNANRFDLVALPKLAGVELDRSYLGPDAPWPAASPRRSHPHYYYGGAAALAAGVVLGLAWRGCGGPGRPGPASAGPATHPDRPDPTIGPAERSRIVEGLGRLADRLEVGGSNDPGSLMAAISGRGHYRGPTLSPAEVARLLAEVDPDRDRALAWHDRLAGPLADDRPLPDDFAGRSLPRQLEDLARSFHLDPAIPPGAVPGALSAALSRDGPVRPTPLAARYPALTDYARFLARLPRRE